MRKVFLFALAALMLLSVCGCGKKEEDRTAENQAAYVSRLIDEIGEVGYTSLSAINRAENFYKVLTDEQKTLVTNASVLTAARESYDALTSGDKQGNAMFDRSKLQIGTYCYRSSLWNDADMQKLAAAGVNFICSAAYNTTLLDLCQKYGVGAFVNYLPGWWGGDGGNAGGWSSAVPAESYESYAASFTDHPAIWAMDIGDEPSAKDFPHAGVIIEKAKELFPEKLIYLNLYPNYANSSQLGTGTYAEHIAEYVKNVNTDYICYDNYMYPGKTGFFLENIEIVAGACRENGRDLWIVIQASNSIEQSFLNAAQIEVQAYLSLAYGAKVINWACWTAGWWHPDNQIVDSAGNYTSLYDSVKAVNSEIRAFLDIYDEYVNVGNFYIGQAGGRFFEKTATDALYADKQDIFTEIAVEDGGLVAGYFEKPDGSSYGLMLVNVSDVFSGDTANTVFFSAPHATRVTLYTDGGETVLIPDENGTYSFELDSCGGAFVTVQRDEKAVLDDIYCPSEESVEPAFDVRAFEFAANIKHEKLDAELVQRLYDAGINFVIGNASNEALKLLQEKDMGIFATNFYERFSCARRSFYGYGLPHTTDSVSAVDACERYTGANLLITVPNQALEIKYFLSKSVLGYVYLYVPAICGSMENRDIVYSYFPILNAAASSALENEKALYVTVQTGDTGGIELITPTAGEIKWQIWNALAFGARKIIFSDYPAVSDMALAEVTRTISEISAFKDIYTQYAFKTAYGCVPGEKYSSLSAIAEKDGMPKIDGITALNADKSALFGIFDKSDGIGKALVIVPCDAASTLSGEKIAYTATITLDGTQRKITLYQSGTATELTGEGNVYTVTLTTYNGVFITIE